MLSLRKCLTDIAKFFAISSNSLKVGSILIQWGSSTQSVAADNRVNLTVKFPKSYSATPVVLAESTANTNFPELFQCGTKSITKAQFTMVFRNQHSNAVDLPGVWIAIGKA